VHPSLENDKIADIDHLAIVDFFSKALEERGVSPTEDAVTTAAQKMLAQVDLMAADFLPRFSAVATEILDNQIRGGQQ